MQPTNQILGNTCATVVYLLKEENGITKFYLAQKKQDIHKNSGEVLSDSAIWNGYGGKWEDRDSTILDTAIRELKEEAGVVAKQEDLIQVAHVNFFWPGNTTGVRDMEVTFYLLKKYEGNPIETKEMGPPQLFSLINAPYKNLLPADELIIRNVMDGKDVLGRIYFAKEDGKIVIGKTNLMIRDRK